MTWKKDPRLAYLFVNISALVWSSNIVLGRALRGEVGPLTLTFARYLVAGGLLWLLVLRSSSEDRRIGRDWPLLLGMGLTGILGFSTLLYTAVKFTTASHVALINGTGPLVTAVLAASLLRETLSRNRLIGALLSLVGVGLIITGGSLEAIQKQGLNFGDLLMLLNICIWGVYSILSRIVTRFRSSLSATAFCIWFSLPFLFVAAGLELAQNPPILSWHLLMAIIYIGIFPSVIGYLAWNEGVRRVGPGQAMVFYNMLPVFGVILGVFILDETPGWLELVGGGLVIVSSIWSVWPELMRPASHPVAQTVNTQEKGKLVE